MRARKSHAGHEARWLTMIAGSMLAALSAGPALADEVRVSCGYLYGTTWTQQEQVDSTYPNSAAVNCTDARFGTLNSQATVVDNQLGTYMRLDWNFSPSRPTEIGALSRAMLTDGLQFAGSGNGTATFEMRIHGLLAESASFSLATTAWIAFGSNPDSPDLAWNYTWVDPGSVDQVVKLETPVPFGQSVNVIVGLRIDGAAPNSPLGFVDAVADFGNTLEFLVTRLQDANGNDLPLSLVTTESGRPITPQAPNGAPEPGTLALLGLGLAGLAATRRRKQ